MPHFLARRTETRHYLLGAASPEAAQQEAEELLDCDWSQSDGPLIEVELVESERPRQGNDRGLA